MSEGIAGAGDGNPPLDDPPQPSLPWVNRAGTRPESDYTRDTPVVISTISRSPRSTFWHWVSTTPPDMVIRLALVSNTALSPVTTWSFCFTTTLPRASSRLIEELPPGPGVADCIGVPGAAFAAFCLGGGGGCSGPGLWS